MASYPPPPPNTPWGYDPKQAARIARDQMKAQMQAQKYAVRAQRDMYRYQNRALRRSSILTPVIVLAVGIVILLIRLGRIPLASFGTWYGNWWPVLLVGAGLVLVGEWAFDQIPREDGTPHGRRGIGGGAIFLILVLAATGAAVHHLRTEHNIDLSNLSLDPTAWDEFFGEKHEMSQQLDQVFPAGTSLSVDNPHGDIDVTGKSDDDMIHITVNKDVYSQSDSDAGSKAQLLNPKLVMVGSTLTVTVPAINGALASLSITLPETAPTTINANHGDVAITNLRAPVAVTANHGDVALSSLAGSVSVHINHRSSSLAAHDIVGDVSIHGQADEISVTGVSGRTTLDGEFYGDTHLEHLNGPTSFRTSRTQLTFERLDGEVDISPKSELTGSEIAGPITLRTRSRNIELDRVSGQVDITDSDGSVDLTGAPPLGNVSIDNRNGEVNVSVPEHSGYSIDAETKGGDIENDLGLKSVDQNNTSALTGSVAGGGPHIMIRTTHLDIGIHSKDEGPLAAPATPKPPQAPSTTSPVAPKPTRRDLKPA